MGIFQKIATIFRNIVIGYVYYTFPATLIGFFIIEKYIKGNPEEFVQQPYYGVFLNTLIFIAEAQITIWILISLLFSITMFFSKNNREIFIQKLSGIKERDEREVQIVGRSLRTTYLTTMTILLFLLFISMFKMELSTLSADKVEPGQPRNYLALGWKFSLQDPNAVITNKEGYDEYFEYNSLPISKGSLILILLLWQIVSFMYVSRRLLRVPD